MNDYKINSKGLQIIKDCEGCKLTSYLCPAKVWTIGYGHTGSDVKAYLTITLSKAEELLKKDLVKFESIIKRLVTSEINRNQFSALVSFVYNLGEGNLKSSTLLKKVNKNPNDPSISAEFDKWKLAGGKVLSGLVKRRKMESELYFTK